MEDKENFPKPSGSNASNDSKVSTVAASVIESLNVKRKRPLAALQSSSGADDASATKKLKMEPPTNIEQLRQFFECPELMKQFSFKDKVEDWYGLFDIHTVDDNVYLAFHTNNTVAKLPNRNDCKLFFYNAEELRKQFQRFEVQFEGIEHILMVFVSHKSDRITPLAVFFLPSKNKSILDDMVKKIDQWLNGDGSATTNVTKCTTLYDVDLQDSISKIWPAAKLIGCSDEYQKDIKLFAKQNRGHTTDHHKGLTRLACTLCYVPQPYIPTGIEVIEKRSSSEYGANLVRYLRANWIGLKSVFGEELTHRSIKVCKAFLTRMIENYFQSKSRYTLPKEPLNNFIDFMRILRIFSKVQVIEMSLDGSTLERRRNRRFEMNTKPQKETEAKILSSFTELSQSIEVSSNDEKAIEGQKAIEKFMVSIF